MQQERARQQRRADRLARLAGPGGGGWLWRLLRQGWVRAGYAVADHTRGALILSVFAFKVRLTSGLQSLQGLLQVAVRFIIASDGLGALQMRACSTCKLAMPTCQSS